MTWYIIFKFANIQVVSKYFLSNTNFFMKNVIAINLDKRTCGYLVHNIYFFISSNTHQMDFLTNLY